MASPLRFDRLLCGHGWSHDLEAGAFHRHLVELDERREALGMTKAELARRADITPEAVRRLFIADNPNPTIGTLTAIADALDVDLVARTRTAAAN